MRPRRRQPYFPPLPVTDEQFRDQDDDELDGPHLRTEDAERIGRFVPQQLHAAGSQPLRAPEGTALQRGFMTESALRYWWLIALAVAACAGAAVYVGVTRSPMHSATAQLNVGTLNAQLQAVPGYVEAAKSLASSYSRLALTSEVTAPAGERVGLSAGAVRSSVVVTPVAQNPIISVRAEARTREEAIRLSDSVADELVVAVRKIDTTSEQTSRLLRRFRAASQRAARYEEELRSLKDRRDVDSSAVSLRDIELAQSTAETERLKAQSLGALYTQATTRNAGATGIERFGAPVTATDRDKKLQQLGFVGIAAGVVTGLGLATALNGRRRRRPG